MSMKGTLITLILFIALVGIYMWDKGKRETTEKAKEESAKVLPMEAADVDQLVLENKGEKVEIQQVKSDDEAAEADWQIVSPVKTKADSTQVRLLVDSLVGSRKQESFELSEDQTLADYGLDKPETRVQVKSTGKGQFVNLALGQRKTGLGDFYANAESEQKEVFLISSSVQSTLNKTLFDLRDKTVLAAVPDEVTSVTLSMDLGGQMVAQKRDGHWQLSEPVQDAGDEVAIGDLLRKVDGGKAADFIDTTGTLQLETYGLDSPQMRLSIWAPGFKQERALLVGAKVPEAEQYYAKNTESDQIFMIPGDIQQQMNKSFDEYRSKKLFPTIGSEASRMEIASGTDSYAVAKNDEGQWAIEGADDQKIDQSAVEDLLAALVGLQVKEFDAATTDTSVFGLQNPSMTVALSSQDKKTVERATIGRVNDETREIFAQRQGSNSVLVLEWKDPEQFMKSRADLVEQKVATFAPEDAAAIDIETEGRKYRFEKKEDAWSGSVDEGETKTVPQMEAQSFVNALTGLRYGKFYAAGAQDVEFTTAPSDIETTMTLKSADGKTLIDAGVTGVQMDDRFLRPREGGAYAVKDADYQRVGDALQTLLKTIPEEQPESE